MTTKLYVIGNGFDLHHGIPSSYAAFGKYLSKADAETYELVETYFDVDADFWWEFEARLASFDAETLIDDASSNLVGYGAEDWSDAYHHDYQYEIERVVGAISSTMRARFADWIRQLPVPGPKDFSAVRLPVDPAAWFLNFNYTPSLQRLYAVPDDHVVHIHGSAADPTSQLVLGHGWRPTRSETYRANLDLEAADTRVLEGAAIVDRYFRDTFKPTERIIKDKEPFFHSLGAVTDVCVFGHSLAEVDRRYFEEIIAAIRPETQWTVSYHGDPIPIRDRVAELGIDATRVRLAKLSEL